MKPLLGVPGQSLKKTEKTLFWSAGDGFTISLELPIVPNNRDRRRELPNPPAIFSAVPPFVS